MDDHELAADIAREAGELLLELQARQATKDEGDRLSNELILARLAEARPDDAVLSEESKDSPERLDPRTRVDRRPARRHARVGRRPHRLGGARRARVQRYPERRDGRASRSGKAALDREPTARAARRHRARFACSCLAPGRPRSPSISPSVLDAELVPLGSAGAKAMAVVLGDADVYAHSGGQYEWDSAAPVGVATAAGCHCSRIDGDATALQPARSLSARPAHLSRRARGTGARRRSRRARSHLSRFLRERLPFAPNDRRSVADRARSSRAVSLRRDALVQRGGDDLGDRRAGARVAVRARADRRRRRLDRRAPSPDPRESTTRAIRVFVQPINLGKGAALRRGFREATAPYVIVQDADLEYDPDEYASVLAPLLAGEADVVYGSRFLVRSAAPRPLLLALGRQPVAHDAVEHVHQPEPHRHGDLLQGVPASRSSSRIVIEEDRFGFEPEITAKIAAAGWRVYEVGISYAGRTYAEGKKIGWSDGVRAMYSVVRYSRAWTPRARSSRPCAGPQLPPAEFDDSDAELSDVLALARGSRQLRRLDLQPRRAAPRRRRARDRRRPRRADRAAARGRTRHRDRPLEALRRRARDRFAERRTSRCARSTSRRLGRRAASSTPSCSSTCSSTSTTTRTRSRSSARSLRPGGRLCVFVPAFDGLYSDFDRRIGHRRRYRRSHLIEVFDRAGLEIVDARYVNTVGALAWWLFARQLGQVPAQRGRSPSTTGSSCRSCAGSSANARPASVNRCSASGFCTIRKPGSLHSIGPTGCGAAWLARSVRDAEAPGSNPGTPTSERFRPEPRRRARTGQARTREEVAADRRFPRCGWFHRRMFRSNRLTALVAMHRRRRAASRGLRLVVCAKLVAIGAGLSGPNDLRATVYAHGPEERGRVRVRRRGPALGRDRRLHRRRQRRACTSSRSAGAKPVEVVSGLHTPLGLLWYRGALYVASTGRVDAYSDLHAAQRSRATARSSRCRRRSARATTSCSRRTAACSWASPRRATTARRRRSYSAAIISFRPDGTRPARVRERHPRAGGPRLLPGHDRPLRHDEPARRSRDEHARRLARGRARRATTGSSPPATGRAGRACTGVPQPVAVLDKHAAAAGVAIVTGQLGATCRYGGTRRGVGEGRRAPRRADEDGHAAIRARHRRCSRASQNPVADDHDARTTPARRRLDVGEDLRDQHALTHAYSAPVQQPMIATRDVDRDVGAGHRRREVRPGSRARRRAAPCSPCARRRRCS